jgi:hypothetical protein
MSARAITALFTFIFLGRGAIAEQTLPFSLQDHLHAVRGKGERIENSVLAFSEPRRYRNKAHLKFVASHACLLCGRQPADPHHLTFTQPRALGRKVSDEFAVPLCRTHHREVHRFGNERNWWAKYDLDPLSVAEDLWAQTHPAVGGAIPRAVDQAAASQAGSEVPITPSSRGRRSHKTKPITTTASQ